MPGVLAAILDHEDKGRGWWNQELEVAQVSGDDVEPLEKPWMPTCGLLLRLSIVFSPHIFSISVNVTTIHLLAQAKNLEIIQVSSFLSPLTSTPSGRSIHSTS